MNKSMNNEQFAAVIGEARDWLSDAYPAFESHVPQMTPSELRRVIERGHEGGWYGFLAGTATMGVAYSGYDR